MMRTSRATSGVLGAGQSPASGGGAFARRKEANANAGPLVDFGNDGQINAFEYTAGLVPTDHTSRFGIPIAPVAGQPGRKNIIFNPLVLTGGRSYAVEFRPHLATGTRTTFTRTTQSDTSAQRTATDTNATGAKKFY